MATRLPNLDLKTLQNDNLVGIKRAILTYEQICFQKKRGLYNLYKHLSGSKI